MGLLSAFGLSKSKAINAQSSPPVMGENFGTNFQGYFGTSYAAPILRNEAMQVAAMARARQLICGVIASIPLELINKQTGSKLDVVPPWVDQPDYRQPRSTTIAWTVDALLFHPVAYWEVNTVYSDGRPADMAWVANDRVSAILKNYNTVVDYYLVDGNQRPWSGVGSLITFQSITGDGILTTAAGILRAALDVQNAASIAAQTPMATGYIQNHGADIPEAAVESLLTRWKSKRKANATAYLTSTLEYKPIGYSPKEMMYAEAIQSFATQIARACNLAAYWLDADQIRTNTYANRIDMRQDLVDLTLRAFISSIEDRLSMDDICPRGQMVRFAVDETFLRNDAITRLTVIEKMLALGLIDVPEAKEMEGLADDGSDSLSVVPNTPNTPNAKVLEMPKAMGDTSNG